MIGELELVKTSYPNESDYCSIWIFHVNEPYHRVMTVLFEVGDQIYYENINALNDDEKVKIPLDNLVEAMLEAKKLLLEMYGTKASE